MTFIAALGCGGIQAPCLFDGPINGEAFLAWVRQILVPTLKPGEVVIMDNLGSHRGKAVRRAIREAGAKLLFPPKYSPDLNPIEQVFSKLKHLLRKAQARSYDAILAAIGEVLGTFTPKECAIALRVVDSPLILSFSRKGRRNGAAPDNSEINVWRVRRRPLTPWGTGRGRLGKRSIGFDLIAE
jgi:transposase